MKRSKKMLTPMDASNINAITFGSATITPTTTHPISIEHNRRFVHQIVYGIFDDKKGTCDVSSSQCSSRLQLHSSEYSYDKRLKYWKTVLKDREELNRKIQRENTKCSAAEILYNRLTTIDERDKQTVKRIIDYADRLNPENLSYRKKNALPEKYNKVTGEAILEIQETLPRAEREKTTNVEICGLPKVTKLELIGKCKNLSVDKSNNWLKSAHLEQRIEEKREDIERVIEFYPDIENLQIVGESLLQSQVIEHNSEIQLQRPLEHICEISSDSKEDEKLCETDCKQLPLVEVEPEPIEYGLKVNDQVFILNNKKSSKTIDIEKRFTCQPFGRDVKKLMTVQNIGRKVLNFEWSYRSYYKKNSLLLKSLDNEFVFDNRPYRLCREETKDLSVLYQPRKVGIVKSKWVLKVEPAFFCRKIDGIAVHIIGLCEPHREYEKKLFELQCNIIEKSNMRMMRTLTAGLGAITPHLEPIAEAVCPYQRTLNELELFEQFNTGFKCDRYHDLKMLKDLHGRVKKPREKLWDFRVDSLKCAVLRVPDPALRALYLNELSSILDSLKGGKSLEMEQRILENSEKVQARLLYVRGIICTCIDEWQELVASLEEAFLKTTLPAFLEESDENNQQFRAEENDEDARRLYILEKRVRPLKAFRDIMYVQTYTLLCNFAENLVNIIESTEVI